jgi:PAS domain S-box-containing protein
MSAGSAPAGTVAPAQDGWETLFWAVFERSTNPIVLLDEQQRVLEVNEPALTLMGQARGEVLGTSIRERFPAAERSAATRDWHSLLRNGERVGERTLVRPDGSSVAVEWAGRSAEIGGRRVVIAVYLRGSPLTSPAHAGRPVRALTRREREVVTLIALGYDTREIAASLVVSPETVKSHVRKAMSKLGARTRAQLVAVALADGQIAAVPHLGEESLPGHR